jgi:PAS domain S-box-containing protein
MLLQLANTNEATARRKVEKISADIEDLYNNAPCGYHSLDAKGIFSAINQTELNWLGYKHSEVIGKMHFTDIVDKHSAQVFKENFDRFKQNGSVKDLRFNMVSKSGRVFPVSLNATAIFDIEGNYLSSRSTIFNIESVVQSEVELKEAKRIAVESAQIKEQFLANMSHEIRTPVNSMIGFTNLLQKTKLSEDQQQYVKLIQSASESLLTIINEILDISKIEAGMLRIEIQPFSLRGLCNSIETMFYHRAMEKNLSFSVQVQDDIPDTLNGDPVRLTQILVNLIANAIKFTSEGSIKVVITMPVQTGESVRLIFSILDTGIGISPDKLESIFERFEQGDTDTTRKYGGTGLGLAIVKKLVEIQEGDIRVISHPGKGTEFQLEMEYGLITNGNNTHITYDRDTETLDPILLKGIRILIVEDNEMNQLLMRHTFRNWQMEFDIAGNGKQAIERLEREKYDLVLLDIQMPVMDGYATAQAIRKELKSSIPIIAMTAHAMPGEREKCLSHGMNDYIPKPLHERELQQLLKKYLQKKGESVELLKAELKYIDLNFLWDLVMENVEFMQNVLRQFMKQFPGEMENLKEAVASADHKKIASLAHHIQSTVSVLGKKTPFFAELENLEKTALDRGTAQLLTATFNSLNEHKQLLLRDIDRLTKAEME